MFIVKNKFVFIAISVLLAVGAVYFIFGQGLKSGIDFTGGTLAEIEFTTTRPESSAVETALKALKVEPAIVQTAGDKGFIIRSRQMTDGERVQLLGALNSLAASTSTPVAVVQKQFDSIGPVIGEEMRAKAIWAVALAIMLIVLYVTFAFRRVSFPVPSWKYGAIVIVTLLHDTLIPAGFYAMMGKETDVLFVTAVLAILGFSVHDTIVVFDRVRENLKLQPRGETFEQTVGKSLGQTFARSINTSLTVVLVLAVLFFVGGASTRDFSLTLIVGIVAGTYSSIFFASPLLILAEKWQGTSSGKKK